MLTMMRVGAWREMGHSVFKRAWRRTYSPARLSAVCNLCNQAAGFLRLRGSIFKVHVTFFVNPFAETNCRLPSRYCRPGLRLPAKQGLGRLTLCGGHFAAARLSRSK